MCTVSYIPFRDHKYFTTNRDEKITRKPAGTPSLKVHEGTLLIYPVDGEAGGSWIVLKNNGDAAVLLNGAFLCHVSEPPYRKSRGLILLDLITHDRPSYKFSKTDLAEIEPFTVILLEKNSLYEFRWDGNEKFCRQLPSIRPHIWSSATLYDDLTVKKREQKFAELLNRKPNLTHLDIMRFHQYEMNGEKDIDKKLNEDNLIETISITSIHLTTDRASMVYEDLRNKLKKEINIILQEALME